MTAVDSPSELCPACGRAMAQGCLHCAMLAAVEAATSSPESADDLPELGEAGFAAFADLALPREVGRFRLLARLGIGGMGTVYEAEDAVLGRRVAVKMNRAFHFETMDERLRFQREATAAARLDHPHIVPIYEVGELDGHAFLAMKLVSGGTLADCVRGGAMDARAAAGIMAKVAAAVQHAHDKGVLHRDLKPSNILIDEAGKPWLTDFGMARIEGGTGELTTTAAQIGTPQYMSPEQAAGRAREVGAASDVWALGAMLYQMLSGRAPYAGESNLAIMHAVVAEEPPRLQASGRELGLAVMIERCLQKDASQRLPSAGMLAEELERWLAGERILSKPVRMWQRWWWVAAAVVVIGLLLTLGGNPSQPAQRVSVVVEEQRILPPDEAGEATYGRAVAVDGGTMVVGAPLQGAGAAYVYGRVGQRWLRQAVLTLGAGKAGDEFGRAVAVHGDTIVVGAHGEDGTAHGSGAAYVFTREDRAWKQTATLKAASPGGGDGFGRAVSMDGDTIVVGSRLEDALIQDQKHNDAGAAYVFVRDGLAWKQQARLVSPHPAALHLFGISVCIERDTVIVGADGEDYLPVPQSFIIQRRLNTGAAYVFTRAGTAWSLQARLAPAEGYGGCFGYSVALSGDTALIGSYRNNCSTTDTKTAPDHNAREAGAAFVFVRDGTDWRQQAYIKPGNNRAGNRFGFHVALQADTAVIGAYAESSGATGINAKPDAECAEAGAVYVFQRAAAQWSQTDYVKASYTTSMDHLGIALALDGDTLVAGASGSYRQPFGRGQVWTFRVK